MKKQLVAAALSLGLLGPALTVPASANDGWGGKKKIKHVLLISVDGTHALDVANYVKNNKGSALAELAGHGITYSNARDASEFRFVSGIAGAGDGRISVEPWIVL